MEKNEIHDLALGVAMRALDKKINSSDIDFPLMVQVAHWAYRKAKDKIEQDDSNIVVGDLDVDSLF